MAASTICERPARSAERAVVLFSGGLDSSTCLALALSLGREVIALTVDYGQRHGAELTAAREVAEELGGVEHRVVAVDLRAFGGSALTDVAIPVPKDREPGASGIPPTYVPARNTILLALALACAESAGAREVWIGVNAIDYSGYPDCRPAFLEAFQSLAELATRAGVEEEGAPRLVAPLSGMTKAEIVRLGDELGLAQAATLSCYDPDVDGLACGRCEACRLRQRGFVAAGVPDPTHYA